MNSVIAYEMESFFFGPSVSRVLTYGKLFVQQVRNSERTPLVSVLLEGSIGSGKTAIAAKMATESDYPYVKMVSPEMLVGYSETGKCSKITKIFDDSYKSPISCIVVDDMERILDYVRIGPRFSNAILQTLLVLLKKEPPKGHRLLIICTTSNKRVLEEMELLDIFHSHLQIPQITNAEEFKVALRELKAFSELDIITVAKAFTSPISIKKLIMITEMAKQGSGANLDLDRFTQYLKEASF